MQCCRDRGPAGRGAGEMTLLTGTTQVLCCVSAVMCDGKRRAYEAAKMVLLKQDANASMMWLKCGAHKWSWSHSGRLCLQGAIAWDLAGTHGWILERGLSCPIELIKEVKSTRLKPHIPSCYLRTHITQCSYVSGDEGQASVGCTMWATAFGMAALATVVNTPVSHHNA